MASLERRGNRFRVVFRYLGQKYQHPLKTTDLKDAELACSRIEENLRYLERGLFSLPPGVDLPTFLLLGGKLSASQKPTKSLTLGELSHRYKEAISIGALEENSRHTVAIQLRHIAETLGEGFKLRELTGESLQEHINRRRKTGKGVRGKLLSAYTIRKEIVTFGAAFKWRVEMGLLSGTFPNRELKYPKLDEKEPFLTWDEITRRIRSGGLSEVEVDSLWDSLFLSTSEVAELLEHVKKTAFQPWVFPMVAFAAHTGEEE